MVSLSRFQWADTLRHMIPANPISPMPIAFTIADRKIIALSQWIPLPPSLQSTPAVEKMEEMSKDLTIATFAQTEQCFYFCGLLVVANRAPSRTH